MAIGFDKLTSDVNFDWLGDIPGKLEASRIRDVRKQSLANINVNDSKSLMNAGTKLFNAGDFEGGLKLIEQGKGLKQAETAAFSQEQYLAYLKNQQGKKPEELGVGPTAPGYADPFFPAPPGAGVRAPAPAGGAPSWLSPDVLKGVPGAPPGPRAEAMPDYENAPPYQVAGPAVAGPTGPGPAPGDETFGPIPPAGAKSVIPPGTLPSTEAPQRAPQPAMPPGDPIAAEMAKRAGPALERLRMAPAGPMGAAVRQAAYAELRYYLDQAKVPEDKKNWWIFNLDRMRDAYAEGDTETQPLNYDQYKHQKDIAKGQFETAEKLYQSAQDNRRKMETLRPALDRLEAIGKHEAFTSGAGTKTVEGGKAVLLNFKDWLVKNGYPVRQDIAEAVDNATTSVRLREAYTSIVNSVIFDKLGSLGAQTSDRDLSFTKDTFPSLQNSVKGNQMIIEYYKDVIKKHREVAEQLQDAYGRFKKTGRTFDQHEIDKITTAFWKDPKNDVLGSEETGLTTLGKRMKSHLAELPGEGPLAAPPPGGAGYGAVKKLLDSPGGPTAPPVGGGAGGLTPAQQRALGGVEVEDEKTGKRFRWTPGGKLVPVE
jgi:hypothetical protein